MFSQHVNPTTGRVEWVRMEKDYKCEEEDLSSELAR